MIMSLRKKGIEKDKDEKGKEKEKKERKKGKKKREKKKKEKIDGFWLTRENNQIFLGGKIKKL